MLQIRPHELQAVAKAVTLLAKFGLCDRPAASALADLRARYIISRVGMGSIINDALGPACAKDASEFDLYDVSGKQVDMGPGCAGIRLVEFLLQFDQEALPPRIVHRSSGHTYYL